MEIELEKRNKRGQGLSTNAIILIVLGVIVLGVLIFGFTLGFSKILPFISTGNEVSTVVTACTLSCETRSQYDFCEVKRTFTDEDKVEVKDKTCSDLVKTPYTKYGIQDCPAVTCPEGTTSSIDDIQDAGDVE